MNTSCRVGNFGVSPDLLHKLINELNMHGAKAISIGDHRVITTTSIRTIQGETKIDGYPLRNYPVEVKVIAEDWDSANKFNHMQVSAIPDDFSLITLNWEFPRRSNN